MATVQKSGLYLWKVQIRKKGHPSPTFDVRSEAYAWSRQVAWEMDRGLFVSDSRPKIQPSPNSSIVTSGKSRRKNPPATRAGSIFVTGEEERDWPGALCPRSRYQAVHPSGHMEALQIEDKIFD